MSEIIDLVKIEQPRDPRGLPKVVAYIDSGKKRSQGEGNFLNRVELYRTNVYTGSSDDNPYGEKTEEECYRLNLGSRANNKLAIADSSAIDILIAALNRLRTDFPLGEKERVL